MKEVLKASAIIGAAGIAWWLVAHWVESMPNRQWVGLLVIVAAYGLCFLLLVLSRDLDNIRAEVSSMKDEVLSLTQAHDERVTAWLRDVRNQVRDLSQNVEHLQRRDSVEHLPE